MAMEWIDEDFKNMRFNVWKDKSDVMFDENSVFYDYVEFQVKSFLDRTCVLRYICFMYDKNSPLLNKTENVYQARLEAAELAGFKKTKKGEFPNVVNYMMVGDNKAVNHMIVRYLSMFHDINYMTYRVYKDKHFDLMANVKSETNNKDLESLLKLTKTLIKDTDDLITKVFVQDDSDFLIEAMYEQASMDELELSPELVTKRLIQGITVVDKPPYGDHVNELYSIGEIKNKKK